jgi:putative DNA primase/helicase
MTFIDFARAHGVDIDPGKLYASDKIRRTGTVDKPRSGNGAYWWDGKRGWAFNWSGEARTIWYEDPNAQPWTDQEKRDWMLKRQTANAQKDRSYEVAAQKADIILRSAKKSKHNYLHLKGFPDLEALVLDETLLVPMRNVVTNKLQGYQQIFWNMDERKWEKKMLTGMRAKNAVLFMGDRKAEEAWLVEGYATGLSVHAALRSAGLSASVVVCFSAGNLVQVADQIPGRKFCFADNDESQTGEKAAKSAELPYAMADTVGWDANDLHKAKGQYAVMAKIMECRLKSLVHS